MRPRHVPETLFGAAAGAAAAVWLQRWAYRKFVMPDPGQRAQQQAEVGRRLAEWFDRRKVMRKPHHRHLRVVRGPLTRDDVDYLQDRYPELDVVEYGGGVIE